MSELNSTSLKTGTATSRIAETICIPDPCPKCKGSGKLVIALPTEEGVEIPEGIDRATWFALKHQGGMGFVSPRPVCPDCLGVGILVADLPGEYPPPPKDKKRFGLSPDQKLAIDEVMAWMSTKEKRKTLGGFAGTGKTTIISHLLKTMKGMSIRVCAPTGKAAAVLKNKGVNACTLHKLVYQPENHCLIHGLVSPVESKLGRSKARVCDKCNRPVKTKWVKVPIIRADLVIVDESSMLNQSMVEDVEALVTKILYVGDHGQLEPIGRDPGIMWEPAIRLEQIHRQAEHSGIIQLAHHMRRGSRPQLWRPGEMEGARVAQVSKLTPRALDQFDVILCGYNKTRKDVNASLRHLRGFRDSLPEEGERIICLQNDSDLGFYNGLLVTVVCRRESYERPRYDLVDEVGNEFFDVYVDPDQFEAEKKLEYCPKGIGLFDFGYCLTVHKAQGSEWDKVAVIEQIARSWDPARWRYTAATRAAKRLEYWLPQRRM